MTIFELSKNKQLVGDIQVALHRVGYLDPKITIHFGKAVAKIGDGIVGPNTEASMRQYFGIEGDDFLQTDIDMLLSAQPQVDLSLGDPAAKIVGHMLDEGYYVSANPDTLNIVYLEGVNDDMTLNDNAPDRWNDLRILIKVQPDGKPTIVRSYIATTGPGRYYTEKPMNPMGCARIAFGQYKSWVMGIHAGKQPALRQCANILVHRDLNKDGLREGDKVWAVPATINQHSTSPSFNADSIGKWSAGCLVGKNYGSHLEFIDRLQTDVRYIANNGYVFMTTVLDGKLIFGNG